MSAALKQPPGHMTVAEFVLWDPGDRTGGRWQLIDGTPVAMAPASDAHGSVQAELAALLRNHLLDSGLPCRVVTEGGIIPRVGAAENFRIPDVLVTRAPAGDTVAVPEPVLVVEILSPGNEAETRANIWAFTTIHSVREIVVLHGTRRQAEVLCRLPDGNWPDRPAVVGDGDVLGLSSIGFAGPLAALYRTTTLATG